MRLIPLFFFFIFDLFDLFYFLFLQSCVFRRLAQHVFWLFPNEDEKREEDISGKESVLLTDLFWFC